MDIIYRWFIGDMGQIGIYEYKAIHIISTIVVFVLLVLFALFAKLSKNTITKRKVLVIFSYSLLGFEVFWRIIYIFLMKVDFNMLWPMYPCNLGGILVPIIAITDNKLLKKMFYLFAFVGGVLTFAMPGAVFCNNVLVFPILKSIVQHIGILAIPLYEYVSNTYKPSLKHYPLVICGCLIHIFNCEVITKLIGLVGDFMYLNSGLPFRIPGVPSWIVITIFGSLVLLVLSYVLNIKESNKCIKNIV